MIINQNKFKCIHLESNMDGCYCKLGIDPEHYNHCVLPFRKDTCDYYEEKAHKIKELASDMDYACTKHDLWPEDAKEIAKVLDALGYKKIKEDEIVIKKSEYENLTRKKLPRCDKCVFEVICPNKNADRNGECPSYIENIKLNKEY